MIEQILINDISVYKKHNVTGEYKYFLTNGFGCSTIWFKNPKDAYNLFIKNNKKIPEGRDSELCNICASHYSVFNEKTPIEPLNKSHLVNLNEPTNPIFGNGIVYSRSALLTPFFALKPVLRNIT